MAKSPVIEMSVGDRTALKSKMSSALVSLSILFAVFTGGYVLGKWAGKAETYRLLNGLIFKQGIECQTKK